MIFSKDKDVRLFVELSYDNLQYHPFIEFSKTALFTILSNGSSETEFIMSTFNSCKDLKKNSNITNYRLRFQSDSDQFFLFEECPLTNYSEAKTKIVSKNIVDELVKFRLLTLKEIEVLRYIYDGKNKKDIVQTLKMQKSTFNLHIKRIYKKLEVHNTNELFKWCEKFLVLMK